MNLPQENYVWFTSGNFTFIVILVVGIFFLTVFFLYNQIRKQKNILQLESKDNENRIREEYIKIENRQKEIELAYTNKIKEDQLNLDKSQAELKVFYQNWALTELEKFKLTEIEKVKRTAEDQYREAALVVLQKWKIEEEAKIRQDAINRSYAVNLGKITEHLVPFHLKFPFNPKDVRFIGSPIDMIVFDGHSEKKDDIIIWIVEVKTGKSKLTEGQQKIKRSVKNAEIRWYEINPDDENSIEIVTNDIEKESIEDMQLALFDIFPKEIFNDAIEITAQEVEKGVNVSKSIKVGIESFRKTDWYKGLSTDKKLKAEDEFTHYIAELVKQEKDEEA